MSEQQEVRLQWHEIQLLLHLMGQSIDAQNRLMRQASENLFQKLFPLYEAGPQAEFVIQVKARKTE